MPDPNHDIHDVAILGSGLAGAVLATILARQGRRVVLLEAKDHPRFAIGESTVPEFSALAKCLAARFDVPELAWLGSHQQLKRRVSANSGVKRNFTFLTHRPDRPLRAADAVQFPTLTYPLGPDAHLYRPDVDAWLVALAVRYGAEHLDRAAVERLDLEGPDGVTVAARVGGAVREVRARYLVDAAGYRSPVAAQLGLREPPRLRADTRTIFTHMVGVRELDEVLDAGGDAGKALGLPSAPDQGTLHHLFEGGWFWVIPFQNHTGAPNPVTSVGLTLDRRVHPEQGLPPEEELRAFARRCPALARQLDGARAVRSWVSTGRVQYGATQLVGERWCLLPHSAGFVDPLFSGGLTATLHGIKSVARGLLEGLDTGALGPDNPWLADYAEVHARQTDLLDRLVRGAYVAFGDPELFNAWYRVWACCNYLGSTGYVSLHLRHAAGERDALERMWTPPYRAPLALDQPRAAAMVCQAFDVVQRVERGEQEPAAATAALYRLLGQQDWIPPQFQVTRPAHRYLATFTVLPLLAIVLWGKRRAPLDVRREYYGMGAVYFWELTKAMAREAWWALTGFLRVFRAAHASRGRT